MDLKDKKILIVEDDEIARDILAMILKKHYRDVYVAKDGEEGLEKVTVWQPDLVITDLAMPILDGSVMIDRLKSLAPETPLLIVTAYREEAEKFREYPILYKPVNRDDVVNKISEILH